MATKPKTQNVARAFTKSITAWAEGRLFIVESKAQLRKFTNEVDREYFSKPVEVTLRYSSVSTGMLYVTDDVRGEAYPCCSENLVPWAFLTNKERSKLPENSGHTATRRAAS